MKRRLLVVLVAVVLVGLTGVAACQPKVVEKEKVVKETVVVEKAQTVIEERLVTPTPESGEYWKADEVAAGTGADKCQPLASLPKKPSRPWKIGVVGFNNAHPFHGTFQKGARDAAAFYGAEFVDMDAAGQGGSAIVDLAETMMTQGVDAIGVLGQGMAVVDPIGASAQEKGILFIPADSGKTEYSPFTYGVSDALSGKRGGELLAKGVKEVWGAGANELFFIEATHTGIPACVARTGGAAAAFKEAMGLDDEHVLQMDAAAGNVSDMIKAILTAHPNAQFAMIPCWDQLGVDPWNVAREAGRGADVMLVTLGGDKPYADLLITKPQNYYGYVEFQPYCEGWGWTETALALLEGERVVPYVPRMVTTQDTIEERYEELYGALP